MAKDPPDKAEPSKEKLIELGRKAFDDDVKAKEQKRKAEVNSLRVGEFNIKEVKPRLKGLKETSTSETEGGGKITTVGPPRPFVYAVAAAKEEREKSKSKKTPSKESSKEEEA